MPDRFLTDLAQHAVRRHQLDDRYDISDCTTSDQLIRLSSSVSGFEFGCAKTHRKDAGVNLPPSVVTHLVTHFRIPAVRGIPDTSS